MAADGGRVAVFARARHYLWQAEWDFWTSSEGLDQVPGELADAARIHLPPLRQAGLVELVREKTEVLPGVWRVCETCRHGTAGGCGPACVRLAARPPGRDAS